MAIKLNYRETFILHYSVEQIYTSTYYKYVPIIGWTYWHSPTAEGAFDS